MSSHPVFDRPEFDYTHCVYDDDKASLATSIRAVVRRYDTFLDQELFPAQHTYADTLDRFEGWKLRFDSDRVSQLMAEFRQFPCMNDPTEGITEQIYRREGYYPKFLSVVADNDSCITMSTHNNLSHLDPRYRFTDEQGNQRMLAYEVLPYEDDFSRWEVLSKYQSLGCPIGNANYLKRCIVIPKTDLFRSEGGNFWSRRYFGKFDVVAMARADL
ncbi:hypothetical protein [Rhizobium mesoamericanum]|uniref:Cytokinin glycosidase domain-containing protein n=1 Tax=Rhizobium mesoamericanum STM3625 TaxID=1211777 RepID=K0Q3Z1_9HYPH|nr:hypothetical protein [Rhizobium mesoamericanum]CCM79700.1 hypothetical protein BN77_p30133 [Rhizobium mesoamericanum STM3625]